MLDGKCWTETEYLRFFSISVYTQVISGDLSHKTLNYCFTVLDGMILDFRTFTFS